MAKITFENKNAFLGQPFNGLKATEVNEIKASVNALYDGVAGYLVVTELPATIPPGVQLLYNGTMWRGLLEGESSLAAGTPWPVKGFKEWSGLIQWSDSIDKYDILNTFKTDVGALTITGTKESLILDFDGKTNATLTGSFSGYDLADDLVISGCIINGRLAVAIENADEFATPTGNLTLRQYPPLPA